MICVYPADCTDFSTNGNGTLAPLSAEVTETLNGEYELTLVHPIDEAGKWQRLVEGCILRAPVPAAMTPRVNFSAPGDDSGAEVYRIHTDFSGAETRAGTLRLRSGPGTKYKILASYKNKSLVQIIAKTNSSWYEVTAPDGKHGYMSTKYLVFDHREGSASEATSSVVESRQLRDQPFRIYRVVPELDKITVYARHIFYDLLDNMIQSYKPSSSAVGASVVQTVSSSCLSEHDFTFYSDLDSTAEEVEFENVNPVDAILGEGGIVEKYTGELTRDWFDVFVVKRVGQDSNVQIRQAKNLLGISYDIDLTDVVTRIMPTGEDADGNVLYLPELYIDSPLIGSYTHPKWIHLAVSEAKEKTDGDETKTKEQCYVEMRSEAQAQFDAGCDTPTVTLNVDFINCADTEEYREYGFLQNIYLGDAVRVIAPRIGVWVSMRMTQYTYDCLTKKYTQMTLGPVADTVEGNVISARQLPSGIITGSKLAINSVGTGALQSGSVGSVQIQMAAIETAHIQDAAIASAKIADAAIGTAKIQDAAVVKAKIAEGAIGSAQIEDVSITRAKIGNAAIGAAQIEDGVITSAKIGAGEIQTANIHDATITTAKITDGAVKNAKIENGAIDTAKIADAAITNAKIGGAAIGTANIQDGAIVRAKILDGEIVTAKIADLAVTGAKIADLAVTTAKIAQAAITNAQIANAAVDTAQIALGAITAALIAQGAVGTAQIADASITDAKIVELTANKINAGTLSVERLIIRGNNQSLIYAINNMGQPVSAEVDTIDGYVLTQRTITADKIVTHSITANELAAHTITANEILAGTITGNEIAAATIEGSNIKAGTLTTSHVAANFGQTLDLSSNTGINQTVQQIYDDMDAAIAAVGGAEVIVGTQTAATNAWTGVASFDELKDGQTILYWLPFAGTSTAATLNLTLKDGTTTGAKNVYINGTTRCTTQIAVGNVTQMTYRVNTPINGSGSYTGWWITRNQDTTTNYYDRINYKASVTAVGAIAAGRLGVFNSAGKLMLLSTTAFDVTKPILYVGTAYTASVLTQTNNYISWGTAFNLANTVSGFSGTAGATVYIKGTLNGSMLTPAAGVLTTTVPTTEDGYTYVLLGLMSTTTNAVLAPEHPMFRYYNGGFKTVSQIAYEAFVEADEAQQAIADLEIGGRNYVLNSDTESSGAADLIGRYALSEPMVADEEYTVSLSLSMEDLSRITVRTSDGDQVLATIELDDVSLQTVKATFTAQYASGKTPDDDPNYGDILIYRQPTGDANPGTTTIHWIKLEKGNRATDWTAAPEDGEASLETKLSSVRAQISTEADSIRQEVQATYALASDMTQVRSQVGTLSQQSESNFTWAVTRINQLQEDLTNAHEATEDELAIFRTYMSFDENGLVIGKTGNPFTFRVVNDRLAFYMNDTEVAYLSNNKLYVTQAEILSKLIIGHFAFEPQTNGNLSLIYNG